MNEELLRKTYEAFNARDIDTVLAALHADVDWENGMEGGRIPGRDAVRAYWERQFGLIDGRVEPEAFEEGLRLEAESGGRTLEVAWRGAARFAGGEGRGGTGAGA